MASKEFVFGIKLKTDGAEGIKETNAELLSMARAIAIVEKSIKALKLDELNLSDGNKGILDAVNNTIKLAKALDEVSKQLKGIDLKNIKGKDAIKVIGKGLESLHTNLVKIEDQADSKKIIDLDADGAVSALLSIKNVLQEMKGQQKEAADATDEFRNSVSGLGISLTELGATGIAGFGALGEAMRIQPAAEIINSLVRSADKASVGFGKFAEGTVNTGKIVNSALRNTGSHGSSFFRDFSKGLLAVSADFKPWKLSFIEAMAVASPLMIKLGESMQKMSSQTSQTIGTMIIMAGVIAGKFTAAISGLLKLMGSLAQSFGMTILSSLDDFSVKATKAEQATRQFAFELEYFAKTLGERAVGSLSGWNETVKELDKNTSFTSTSIQKSIKLLVAEGTTLGLTFKDNQRLLVEATDIAASSGKSLQEVTQALLSGLAGQSQSAFSLGINLRESALAHGELGHSTEESNEHLSDQAKLQARLSIITARATALQGAASDAADTAAGRSIRYNKVLEDLQAKLGGVNIITKTYEETNITLLNVLNSLPDVFFDIASGLGEVAGVLLVVGGWLLQNMLLVSGLITVYKLLNAAVGASVIVQGLLSSMLNSVNSLIGLQAIEVTSLTGALTALQAAMLRIISLGMAGALKIITGALLSMLAVVKTLLALLWKFIAANAALFAKIALLIAIIYSVVVAIKELSDEVGGSTVIFEGFIAPVREVGIALGIVDEKATEASASFGIIDRVMQAFLDTVKLSVQGIATLVTIVSIAVATAFMDLQEWFGAAPAAVRRMTEVIDGLEVAIFHLTEGSHKLVEGFSDSKEEMASLGDEAKKTQAKIDAINFDKVAEEAKKLKAINLTLSQSIALIGLDQQETIKKNLEFDLQALKITEEKLTAEKVFHGEAKKQLETQSKLLTQKADAQIEEIKRQELINKTAKAGKLVVKARKAEKVARAPKAVKEKVSDAQRELSSLLKSQAGLQKQLNEFGKEGADLVIMRKNERIKELDLLQKTLVAEGKVGTAEVINLAKAREMKLANLKLDAEADKEKKKSEEEKTKAAEKAAAKALQLGQTVADRLKKSDKDLASRTQSRIQMIQTEAIEQYKSVTAEVAKLAAADELSPTLARSFAQLKKNNLEAAKFDIKEIKTDSIEALRKETDSLLNKGKTDEEQKKAALDLALAAIDAKRAELKAAGLLTEEAKRLLAVQGKEVRKQGQGGGDDDDKDDQSIFDQIVEGFEEGTDMIAGAFDGLSGIMDSFAGIGGDGEALGLTKAMDEMPMMISKGMESFPTIMLAAVDSFVNGLSTLVDKLPEMISKILEMLPEIINKLFEAFGKLVDALPAIFAQLMDALPGIIIQILDKLPDIILKVLDALGEIISKVIEKIPEIIIALAERIGPIVEALVEGLVSNAAKIVIALIDTFILEGGAMKIGLAIAEAILIGLTVGIIRGLAKALLKVGEMIFAGIFDSGLEIKIDWGPVEALPEKIGDAVADVAEGIKAGGGDVFALVDLAQSKAARTIDKSIGQATKRAAQQFKQVMKSSEGLLLRVWEALRAAWLWIYNNIILPLIEGIQAVWDFFVEKILNPLLEGIQAVWDFFIEKILNPLLEGIQAVWDFFIEKILNPLLEGIQAVWDFFVDKILTPFTEGVQAVWDFFKEKILDKFAEGIQATWDWFKTNILDKFASGIQAVFDTLATKGQEAADKISGAITKLPEQARQAAEKLSAAINGLPGKATEFANNVISKLGSIGSTMWNSFTSAFGSMGGVIKDHATWAFDELFRNIKGAFGKMFEGVGGGGTGTIEGLMGTDVPIIRFAEGGVVPGTSPFPGDNKKNDSTVALLSPGEAVIPRSILADPEISRLVQSIMGGNVKFAFGGSLPKVSVSAPKISAPKLPSINDIKTMSTADLAKNLEANFEALKKLATGDLWDMFKDKIFEQVKSMMESIMKSAAGFEDGGIVPNTGMAMVHENEAVLPTGLVDAIMGTTNNKNQQSQNITLNATVNMVGADISGGKKAGKTIIDEMFTELRKRSANQKVMFQSGLIS